MHKGARDSDLVVMQPGYLGGAEIHESSWEPPRPRFGGCCCCLTCDFCASCRVSWAGLGWCPSLKPAVAPQSLLHTLSLIFISACSFPRSQPCRQAGSLPRLTLCHPQPIPTCHLGPRPSLIIPDEYGLFPSSLSVAKFAERLPASGPLHLLSISLACASSRCPPGLLSHSLLCLYFSSLHKLTSFLPFMLTLLCVSS